jgi:hypothetical protein
VELGTVAEGFLDFLNLEDGTNLLSRNSGTELPAYAAQYPRRTHISSTSPRKSEITHGYSEVPMPGR